MSSLLECRSLDAGYVKGRPVVRGFDLALEPGRVTALLGPNGAGKTTVLLTLGGLQPALGGEVLLDGVALPKGSARAAARKGVVLVPDDRALFTGLTTRENLALCRRRGGTTIDQVLDFFPALRKRIKVDAGKLSGGEQQMLAVSRALMLDPRVLLIDELSMGLAPVIVEELLPIVRRVATETNAAVLLVEQHVRLALTIADDAVVLAHGATVLSRSAAELIAEPSILERAYLGETVAVSAGEK
ncbi:ABC transporter ATP-binding protein [Cryptosporangium aurantiacum]|uniref:Amino acid/amide ABC transporter ATP-binding protein 2, HAAT family n=1 Tax=Cryptosporangium aurantiacum TaxID=134849 RepID=A0A1M7R420_9ACTN|nr:ATP-binding cassette domain-containing protein [Cryptosporangium aurantiacum]SHN39910.1 amino acid/amide ABC transporter ATP-binding protein 2, HAAT family [Cryptosporangium aurantiacum]